MPVELTEPIEIVDLPDDFMTMEPGHAARAVGVAYRMQKTRAQQCNGKLIEISKLGENDE